MIVTDSGVGQILSIYSRAMRLLIRSVSTCVSTCVRGVAPRRGAPNWFAAQKLQVVIFSNWGPLQTSVLTLRLGLSMLAHQVRGDKKAQLCEGGALDFFETPSRNHDRQANCYAQVPLVHGKKTWKIRKAIRLAPLVTYPTTNLRLFSSSDARMPQ